MEPLGLFKRFSLPSPNSSALLRHAMGWATEFEAAISVGRTVLNPKMDGRYVTERERKFLIYRALDLPSLGRREATSLISAVRTAQATLALSLRNLGNLLEPLPKQKQRSRCKEWNEH